MTTPPDVVEAQVSLTASLGEIVDRLTRREEHAERAAVDLWQNVHMVPILYTGLTGLAGSTGAVIASPDRMGPSTGFWWDVRRLSIWGFTAGTVNVYLNDISGNGELVASFPQPGQYTWSGGLLLGPDDYLAAITAGVTGSVFLAGQAVEVGTRYLPDYLI